MRWKNKKILSEIFSEELLDYKTSLCKLCGNTGIFQTHPTTPRGFKIGPFTGFCLCPNGRAMKEADRRISNMEK